MGPTMTIMNTESKSKHGRSENQTGFTLIEVMISIVVVTVGLVGLLSAFAVAVASSSNVQLDAVARQKATEALESIYTARQTDQITFSQIANQSVAPGIFVDGMVAMKDPGPDGLDGTADDNGPANVMVPGPSGVLTGASPPDVAINITNFRRQIQIVQDPTNANLKMVTVTVQYPAPQGGQRQYIVQSLISSFR
jgi:prepilin-type N-terminal cleavage/methylation domain-containing protein